jgi:hypothetical protein
VLVCYARGILFQTFVGRLLPCAAFSDLIIYVFIVFIIFSFPDFCWPFTGIGSSPVHIGLENIQFKAEIYLRRSMAKNRPRN